MDNVERALSRFEQGFSCSQSVLSAYGPQLGLDAELALRVSGAFGGGMARMGRTCGAVTGALMAIGLQRGSTKADDDEAKDACYDLAREFVDRFEARHGSITCQELLGYDISTPEGRALAKEQGLFATLCPKLVQDAAEIVGQILEE
jgi:C_GCAxxG_C_C family probable redox protein